MIPVKRYTGGPFTPDETAYWADRGAPWARRRLADRRALCEVDGVTLNGRPAVIRGAREGFATVSAIPDGESYQWSWDSVARIVDAGGRFTS